MSSKERTKTYKQIDSLIKIEITTRQSLDLDFFCVPSYFHSFGLVVAFREDF